MKKNEYGFLGPEFAEIVRTISSRDSVESALIFGSRAKGNYRAGSDVDIALKGPAVCHADVLEVGYSLNEERLLPYQFDIIDYNTIDNDALKDHIDRVGREIFRRTIY
jgi:predicted nucleotidyltransferase